MFPTQKEKDGKAVLSQSAFPIAFAAADAMGRPSVQVFTGMTLRDYFAAQALMFLVVDVSPSLVGPEFRPDGTAFDKKAAWCYEMADAMMKAREARPNGK